MKSLAIGSMVATGTAAVAVPTVALTSGNGEIRNPAEDEQGNKPNQNPKPSVPEWAKKLVSKLNSSKDIENKYEEIECLKKHYKDKVDWSKGNGGNPQFTWKDTDKNDIEGCLMVEYHAWKYPEDKWKGEFRLLWSFKSDEQGLVTVVSSKIDDGKISVDASAYVLNKESNKWNASSKKEGEKKDITNANKEELTKWFPEPGNSIGTLRGTDHWGLELDFQKICAANKCPQESATNIVTISKSWKWIPITEGNHIYKIYEWNKNFSTWFNNWFPNWIGSDNKIETFMGMWSGETGK